MTQYNTIQDYQRKPVATKTNTISGFILLTEAQQNYQAGRTFSANDKATADKYGAEVSEIFA
jgi:hypothetical protein